MRASVARAGALACVLLAAVLSGCSTPIGVRRVDVQTVHRELTTSVLSTGRPSAATVQVLYRLGLFDRFARDPDGVLAELHAGLPATGDEDRVYALAELSFLRGEQTKDPLRLLGAAVYAYAFLFPGDDATPPGPFDPRLRVAGDLYNRALTAGLLIPGEDGRRAIEGGRFRLPFASLAIRPAPPDFEWAGYRLTRFESAADFEVRGLRNRYRLRGIGAPLAAQISSEPGDANPPPGHERIPPAMRVPVCLLLRIERPREGIAAGRLRAVLSLHSPDDARSVAIDGREVPLEFETTATLALGLEHSQLWEFERSGFRIGDLRLFEGDRRLEDGLFMLGPYRAGHIPVVLVHGTASSPARWAELVNELENDPRIWERYQIWLFMYNTGNPIAVSGGLLAEALRHSVAELDPDRRDPALQQMVVIGHSQGGLLAKLTAIDSGNRFWRSDVPLDELEIAPETRELAERSLFFEPLPFVRRVIFIATPHRGSYLTLVRFAGLQPARWAARMVELPGELASAAVELVSADPERELRRDLDELPTSIDNMTPGNPFLETLAAIPVAPGIATHSIIAVAGEGPPEEGGDGVVKYTSAHIEGVESELVVRSGHSVQSNPEAIEEVRRILLEHAAAFESRSPSPPTTRRSPTEPTERRDAIE